MRHVLVTGATGFVGTHLVENLIDQNIKITILIRNSGKIPQHWENKAEVVIGELTRSETIRGICENVDTVFHLAAKVHDFSKSNNSESEHRNVNVLGFKNVLDQCRPNTHVIYFSSVKAMEEEFADQLDENSAPHPLSAYGLSKLQAEELLREYVKYKNIRGTVIRLPLVYGPGGKGNMDRMISAINKGSFFRIGKCENFRSMVHVGNVVQAAIHVANSPSSDFRLFIVTDTIDYTVDELCTLISKHLNKKAPFRLPSLFALALAKTGDLAEKLVRRPLPFNSSTLKKLTGTYTFKSDLIREQIGYVPQFNLQNSMATIIEKWHKNL